MKPAESPKRSAISWLNRIEFHLRQLRKNADNSDVVTYTECIDKIKRLLRTFRPHRSNKRRSDKKPAESSFYARTIQYPKPNIIERRPS